MSGKPRRRVTVENTKQVPEAVDSKRKPSVFERLGPGAPPRNYDQPATSNPERYDKTKGCNSWMKTGVCNYGKTCRYQHPPRREHNAEDLRNKVGRRRDTTQSEDSPDDSDSDSDRKSREHVRKRASRSHEKEGKMRSTVVLTKKRNVPDVSDSGSEPWQSAPSADEPGFESELELEKQRQALQRELRTLQEAEAEESRLDNIFIQRETQSSSDSDSSSDGSPPPPQKKDKQRGRMPQPEEPQHSRKKLTPKEKRRKARVSVSKTRQARPASSPEAGDRERNRARKGEEHSVKQRPPREPSSDDGDDQSPEPPPRPSKERRRRSISEQRHRKRSPSSSDERQKSPVEPRRKKLPPVEQHHKRSPERKRKVSQPPPRERPQQQHKEKERERERERIEKEREKEREKELREREREKEQEMREREKARGREKERHEAPRRVAGKKSPPGPPEKVRSRKVTTPDISPRPEKRQRQDSPEYERKKPQKRSETPDARPTRDHQVQSREHQVPLRESRRGAPEPEPKGKRAFPPRDSSASRPAKRHASPVDYKRSRSPESQKVRTPDPPAKARRGRVEDREGRVRTQESPSDSHRSGSRHNSPDPRTQPNRHVTPEGRTRRDREREGREVRDQREGREGREGREIKDGARDSHREQRDAREPKVGREVREMRGNKDKEMQERDTRDQREMRDEREPRPLREREPRGDIRPGKERDLRDHEPVIRDPKEMQGQRERKQVGRAAPIENAINKRLAQLAQSSTNEENLAEPVIPVRGRKRGGAAGVGGPPQRPEPRQRHPEETREPPVRRGTGRQVAPAEFESPVKAAPQPVPRVERRGRKDISPDQRPVPRTVTPEPKRGAKERRPADRVPAGERVRPPVVTPEPLPLPRDRELRNIRGMRDKEGRERDDSRGSRERVDRTELEGRAPRDIKEREPRARDMKEVHDERDLIDRGNRSTDRSVERGIDRGVDRNLDRSIERGMDRSMERNVDRNLDRGHGAMNRALSPLMGRGGFDKSRSPPAPRRRLTPEPARGRRLSPEDMRSQGHLPGHSPYHDEYDAPMMHPDHLSPPDLLPEEFDHGRGRMGRNDRFSGGHRMPEERFDRTLERDRGDRFEPPPVDDRRFRGRDQFEHEPGFMERNLMPRDMEDDFITTERDDLWSGDNQWPNNRGRPDQMSRRGGRGRGREEQGRTRRGRGRGGGDGRRGEEPFPFRDDQYLQDTPLPQERWPMWDEQPHPDDRLGDNRQGGGRRMQGRHGGRGQDRPADMDRHGGRMFVDELSDEQTSPYEQPSSLLRHKRSYIDDLTPPPKRRDLSPSGSQQSGNRGSLGRDVRGDMMLIDGIEPRDGRDMGPRNLRGGSHDRVGPMRDREGREIRDAREPRELRDVRDMRDMREPRDAREPRDSREPRDNWDGRDPRDIRDLRDVREPHDLMDPRDGRDLRDNREPRDARDPKDVRDLREPRDARESRDMREPREVREPREARDIRDARDQREPRDGREVKDVRDPKEPREPRDARSREGRGQRDRGREGAGSERGGPEPDEIMPRDRREKRIDPEADLPLTTKRPRSASPSPAGRGRKRQRGPSEKPAAERRGEKPWPDEPKRTPTKEGSLPRPTDSPAERRPGREHDDSTSHGIEKAPFSDWSDDGEMFGPHNKVEEDVDPPLPVVRGPGYHEGAERAHRSPSRSSIGSRHSHREERPSGYRSDDMRRNSASAPGVIQDSWSDGEHAPGEWSRGPGAGGVVGGAGPGGPPHRMPSFQGEPHSPLDVASTPPWERSNRRRNRGGSEVPDRERPPPPPPGSFGEAEAAVRAHYRNGEEPPTAPPQAVPSPAAAPAPAAKADGEARTSLTNKKKTKSSDKPGRNGEKLYDDISDDDLDDLIENVETEVEEKKKTGVSDVMDIDWSCLVKESQQQVQAAPTTGVSVLSRFSPANVFAQIGVSRAYAGEALFSRLKHVCQRQIDKEASTEDQNEVAGEQPATTEPAPRFDILNDVAALHDAEQRRRRERATVLQRIGPFRRALCARRDLILRRYLCRLDQESDVSGIFATPIIDQDLYRQSLQFLRQGSSERKFSALQETEPMSL